MWSSLRFFFDKKTSEISSDLYKFFRRKKERQEKGGKITMGYAMSMFVERGRQEGRQEGIQEERIFYIKPGEQGKRPFKPVNTWPEGFLYHFGSGERY